MDHYKKKHHNLFNVRRSVIVSSGVRQLILTIFRSEIYIIKGKINELPINKGYSYFHSHLVGVGFLNYSVIQKITLLKFTINPLLLSIDIL